jgi:pyridoxal phosphate enzyme (YggS family)
VNTDEKADDVGPADAEPGAEPERLARLRTNLQAVRQRIAAGCVAAGRDPGGITLVVITKTYPAADVRLLAGLGVHDVGENRDQEAGPKHEACVDLPLTWHFVGRLQSNKAHSVVRYADLVHSVDRPSLVGALGRASRAAGRSLDCLIQVSVDGDPHRGGAVVGDVPALADAIAAEQGLHLRGLMAVAPLGMAAREAFAVLPLLRERLGTDHPDAVFISAGMSADLEPALAEGATHLRVGSAVLGARR